MNSGWSFWGSCAVVLFLIQCRIHGCLSLNLEGLALLAFRVGVEDDPHGAFEDWDSSDEDPCRWSGVHCVDGKVESLYLNELSLRGVLAPELGKLSHLRALLLRKNNFTGVIPKELGSLTVLELLDLRGNNLSGTIPRELEQVLSLKCLMLRGNKFQGSTPSWIEKLDVISDLKDDSDLSYEIDSGIGCTDIKAMHGFNTTSDASHDHGEKHSNILLNNFAEPYIMQNAHVVNNARRRLLQENRNLPAIPASSAPPLEVSAVPSLGSGSFPAVPSSNDSLRPTTPTKPPDSSQSGQTPNNSVVEPASSKKIRNWVYVLIAIGAAFLLFLAVIMILVCRRRRGGSIGPWKTGISSQLQKAFITGVQNLNRLELEAACEDFSNIITTFPTCTLFKGTLSSGVEICVVSTTVKSPMDWSEQAELRYRKNIDTLSRINHKNFFNLLGYCEEEEPFMRMLVFEYTPNGTLYNHLHVKEYEPIDWRARMRIIMGMAYCLQYMHHELNPPVALLDLQSNAVFITDDSAAKIVDIGIFREAPAKKRISAGDEKELSKSSNADSGSNVFSFGLLMLEIVSGRLLFSKDEGCILEWGATYLSNERDFSSLVDPTLKSSNENELEVVCETIRSCLCNDPKHRPTMKQVTTSLRDVLGISPEAAAPRLSPLWWAELEILSVEAS